MAGTHTHAHAHTHTLAGRQATHVIVTVCVCVCNLHDMFCLGEFMASMSVCMLYVQKTPDFQLVSYEHVGKVCVCNSHFT